MTILTKLQKWAESLHRSNLDGNDKYLCSFHIAKTGGTTFAHHAKASLKDGQFFQHGPFARVQRFMDNRPQLEEMNEADLAQIKIVHGHGAGLRLAEAIKGRTPQFMTIMRDPYTRFVSGFHHANSERRNNALPPLTAEAYYKLRGENPCAMTLLNQFSSLAGPGTGVTIKRVLPILRCFQHLLLTEHMDRQLPEISTLYDLKKDSIEAKRVNDAKVALGIEVEAFRRRNTVDSEIYAVMSEAARRPNSSIGNPFGYDPSALMTHLSHAWRIASDKECLAAAYDDLVSACKKTRHLQAAHLKLLLGTSDHVSEPELLRERMGAALDSWLSDLPDAERSTAHFLSGMMFVNEGEHAHAESYLREALRLNPSNDSALARLAQLLFQRGQKTEAVKHIESAMNLRPDRYINQSVAKTIRQ